jgi:uncharacterized membrane protein YoaK (UPF0700 family)
VSDSVERPRLLLALTGVAASVDAISYLGLGRVFPANMTGNTVLLAVGLASRDYLSAARSALALGGFVCGAAIAGAVTTGRGWTREIVALLGTELAILLTVAAWWNALDSAPSGGSRCALIAMFSVAMGAQSATVTSLGVGVSTTYITGTWTSVSGWIGRSFRPARRQHEQDMPRIGIRCSVLGGYFGVALGCGYLFHAEGATAIWVPVAALAAAWLGSLRVSRRTTRSRHAYRPPSS